MKNPIIPILLIPLVRQFVYPKARKLYTFYSATFYGKDMTTKNPTAADLDIEENVSPIDAEALRFLAKDKSLVVEVGSWKGKSASIIASVLAENGCLFSVDTWGGSEGTWGREVAMSNDILAIFRRNMMILGFQNTVFPLVMPSQMAVSIFPEKSLDMVFIDADHRYEHIKADILAWGKKVKRGSILCGHDCIKKYTEFTPAEQAIINSNLDKDDILGIGHPGVIKAVHECLPEYEIYQNSGVWWTRL